ncbi:ABC transporter permease [Zunongwangia sp. HGR-M22]|uniref:ABC transporter permease n=1 Tax=Zunongwangia sp. HGR-M22 TaxID=3015168 RepID=UPI0022DDAB88|nr:ABC transporter permease [Zunongwangia sp. HGR-M22]WBL24149.1 ABC transporter permease [Zunongwangia sp. HGR-M22]
MLKIELFKLLKEAKTWYAIAAILIIEFIIFFAAYYQGKTVLELLLDNLRQSFYFEGNLLNGNLLLYIVLNSLWFNLPLILMIVSSALITEEYKTGTLKTLMLQAVSKKKLIIAKYITSLIFTILMLGILMLTSFLLAYSIFGDGDLVVYLGTLNFFSSEEAIFRITCAFASGTLSMIFFTTVSITLGIFLKEPTKTWIASALFLILCSIILKADFGMMNDLLFPKLTNSWQQFFNYNLDVKKIVFNNLFLFIYTLLFVRFGIYKFSKSDIG